jgi:hypothetical protein
VSFLQDLAGALGISPAGSATATPGTLLSATA